MAAHHNDHDFYIPGNSVWPPLSCLGLGMFMFGMTMLLHKAHLIGGLTLGTGVMILGYGAFMWFRTLINESRSRGFGSHSVPKVLDLANRYGMIFFIVSELMFFAAFFAAYFYIYGFNAPDWPPSNIETLDIHLPVINTLLLLTSGVTVTFAHHAMIDNDRPYLRTMMMATWMLGVIFLCCQMYEYSHATYAINSGAYGSTFYMLTGFHGFHVLVGSVMLMVLHGRIRRGDFTPANHFYFEAAAWYWHFVDAVWIGLFLFVYVLPL